VRLLSVPPNFAEFTIARAGDTGRAWIERLPDVVADYCRQWSLVVDGAPMHGGMSLVVPVRQGDEPCVLKVGWVDESTTHEALALAAWNGHGTVRLFAAQPEAGVMLLERLNSQRSLCDVSMAEAVVLAGQLLRRLAIPAPEGIPLLKDVVARLSETLPDRWEQCGRPIAWRQLDRACQLAKELGSSAGHLLVNYDLIYADVLAGEREPWLVVDPKVVAGDLEYGVAQLLWRRLEEMEARGGLDTYFPLLTEAAGLDPALARSWTFVRCVDYWLWGASIGLTEDPARCEIITNWLE
jgi:streptomycin 6-kinase